MSKLYEARTGSTRYILQETAAGEQLRFVRQSADGERQFFVPTRLVMEFALEQIATKVSKLILEAVR